MEGAIRVLRLFSPSLRRAGAGDGHILSQVKGISIKQLRELDIHPSNLEHPEIAIQLHWERPQSRLS